MTEYTDYYGNIFIYNEETNSWQDTKRTMSLTSFEMQELMDREGKRATYIEKYYTMPREWIKLEGIVWC